MASSDEHITTDQKIRVGLAIVITISWAVSFIVDILAAKYDPPAYMGPLMLLVAGSVFGQGIVSNAIKQVVANQNPPNPNGNGPVPEPQPTKQEGTPT